MTDVPSTAYRTSSRSPARRWPDETLAGAVLLLLFAALYLLTLDNGLRTGELAGGDLITHQYAQVQGRMSNAPGYPLYTLGGWLWFHAGRLLLGPAGNPIQILSSYSTFWALLALGLLYALMLEAFRVTPPVAEAGRLSRWKPVANRLNMGRGANWSRGFSRFLCLSTRPPEGSIPLLAADDARQTVHDETSASVWPIAFLATAFYGLTYFFWYYAVTTEQYASSVAWTLGVVLLAFRWERLRGDRYLLWLALLTGVGLAHQVTVLAVLPPLLWVVLRTEPGLVRRPKLAAAAVGLALLPLLSYAFVYIRGAQHPEWRGVGEWTSTWDWFWRFISTQQGRDELTWRLTPFFTHEFPALIWRELTWPGLLAGVAGLALLRGRRGQLIWDTIVIYLIFCWIDRLGNWFQVIMPVYALLALGIGLLAARLWRLSEGFLRHAERVNNSNRVAASVQRSISATEGCKLRGEKWRTAARTLILFALAALALYRGMTVYPRADSSDRPDDNGLAPAWAILADSPPTGAAILGTTEELLALSYVTQIWGQRPDLRPIAPTEVTGELVDAGFTVTAAALALLPAEVAANAHYSALGPTVIAVRAAPHFTLPPDWPAAAAPHDFGDGIRLLATQVARRLAGEWAIGLAWQATARPTRDWSVSVRLTQGGAELGQTDRRHPVAGAYPTARWSPGEVITDAYSLALSPAAAPDGLTVILYRVGDDGGFINLHVAQLPLR